MGSRYALMKLSRVKGPGTPGGVALKLFQMSMPSGVSTRYTTKAAVKINNTVSERGLR